MVPSLRVKEQQNPWQVQQYREQQVLRAGGIDDPQRIGGGNQPRGLVCPVQVLRERKLQQVGLLRLHIMVMIRILQTLMEEQPVLTVVSLIH